MTDFKKLLYVEVSVPQKHILVNKMNGAGVLSVLCNQRKKLLNESMSEKVRMIQKIFNH